MASADLRKELDCSVCLSVYTDPVNLICGHNFCRDCIGRVLDTQGKAGGYSCPECRAEFQQRPALYRNITLCNIVENFLSTQPDEEKAGVSCTHCVDFPVPAVKSCLHCEASLCEKHLNVHSKSPEHVLCDPTTSLESRKCSVHKKILEYYCTEDSACICVSCRLDGAHNGHQVKMLAAACEIKKENLKTLHQKLITKQKEAARRIHRLQEHKRKVLEKADGEKAQMNVLLGNLRRQLEDLEKRALGEISGKTEQFLHSVNDLIREMEVKKDELARKMRHIEELCNMTDPLTVLQEPDTGDLCDTEDGDDERHDRLLHDGGGLDVTGILQTLKAGLWEVLTGINKRVLEGDDVWLDENTAGGKLQILDDGKIVTAFPSQDTSLPETPQRFKYSLVLSSQSFSSGRHIFEVDVRGSVRWDVGMCYPSVDRNWDVEACYFNSDNDRGEYNSKYWGVHRQDSYHYYAIDENNERSCFDTPRSQRIRIYLDYKAGKLSFCDPNVLVSCLHTFTTTFTEPLHLVIGVWDDYGYIKICGEGDK